MPPPHHHHPHSKQKPRKTGLLHHGHGSARPRRSSTALDQSTFFDLSPALDPYDSVTLAFLVQSAIAGTKGARVLADTEVQETKQKLTLVRARQHDLERKMGLERKLQDAAVHLSQYHQQQLQEKTKDVEAHVPENTPPAEKQAAADKRLSRYALEEAAVAARKIAAMETEIAGLQTKALELQATLNMHATAVLALTHPGANTAAARVYAQLLREDSSDDNEEEEQGEQLSREIQDGALSQTVNMAYVAGLIARIRAAAPDLAPAGPPHGADANPIDMLTHLVDRLLQSATPTHSAPSHTSAASSPNTSFSSTTTAPTTAASSPLDPAPSPSSSYWQKKYDMVQRQLTSLARENNDSKIRLEMQELEIKDLENQKQYLQQKIIDRLQDPMSIKILRHEFQKSISKDSSLK